MKNYLKLNLEFGRISSQIVTSEIGFEMETVIQKKDLLISENNYVPKNRDNVFFLPGVNIPRVKIKNLTLSHRIKSIRDINKANAIFANELTFGKLVNPKYYFTLSVDIFKNYIELMQSSLDSYHVDKINTALEFYDQDIIIFDHTTKCHLTDDNLTLLNNNNNLFTQLLDDIGNEKFNVVDSDDIELVKYLKDKEIFDESGIIEILNGEDALTINEESRIHLEEMLSSTDVENHTLAMEIMANSEYRSSLLNLMILFEKFHHVFILSGNQNHINFKSLLSYLDLRPDNMRINVDSVMALFIKRNVLTEEWTDVILKLYEDRLKKGESQYFKCHTITLVPEALKCLNINYTRQLNEDFIPEIIEEEEDSSSINWI